MGIVKQDYTKDVSIVLKVILWLLLLQSVLYGNWIIVVIVGIISYACANRCVEWATKLNVSKNWAYFIGFFFSIIGTLIYWRYYLVHSKKK